MGVWRHLQQYFIDIMAVRSISYEKQNSEKTDIPPYNCIEYISTSDIIKVTNIRLSDDIAEYA